MCGHRKVSAGDSSVGLQPAGSASRVEISENQALGENCPVPKEGGKKKSTLCFLHKLLRKTHENIFHALMFY